MSGDSPRGEAPSRFILRVPTPEAAGLSGAGSRVAGSGPPRSDSDLRLTLPTLGAQRRGVVVSGGATVGGMTRQRLFGYGGRLHVWRIKRRLIKRGWFEHN